MKAERLIKILLILQHGEMINTRTLANELGVSERTIHRDMESLSLVGIPVYSERGVAGGWRLVDDWKHKLSYLKEKEIISLFLPSSEKIIADLNLDMSIEELKQKLLLSVPDHVKKSAINLSERIHIDTSSWRNSQEKMKYMDLVQQAVMDSKKLIIHYEKSDQEEKTYEIDPLGLVAKGNTWYLVATNDKKEYRNYRVSRILDMQVLEEQFNRPDDFVLADYWKESKKKFVQSLPEFQVEVEASKHILNRIMFTGRFVRYVKISTVQNESKWIPVSLSFPTEEEAINFILGFGNQMKVIDPLYLQDELTRRAKEVLELYREFPMP